MAAHRPPVRSLLTGFLLAAPLAIASLGLTLACGGGGGGSTPTTPPVTSSAPSITTQPTSATVTAGANASFTVAAAGTSLTYQWQVSTGGAYSNLSDTGVYSGSTSATLAITGATAAMNG